jgi:hypothetical protein
MSSLRTGTRRLLSTTLSVADVLEAGMWLAVPHLLIGFAWAFFNIARIEHLEDLLDSTFFPGAGVAAYLLAAGLWPVGLLVPSVCTA